MDNSKEKIINKLSNGILFIEKCASSDSKSKDSSIVERIKKLIEREVR